MDWMEHLAIVVMMGKMANSGQMDLPELMVNFSTNFKSDLFSTINWNCSTVFAGMFL